MKKLILTATLTLAVGMIGAARTTLDVKGTVYTVDTTFHAKVGPGTTQTSLKLTAGSSPLNVHYLTIDRTVPGVTIRAVCATDKVAGTARTSKMAESKSHAGLDYFAGCNADFFSTSGTASNGTSRVGTPTTSCTVEGEIYKSSKSNYQFSVDTAGVARICRLDYYSGTATLGDKMTLFKGVNVGAPNNGITLLTSRYWGSANQGDYADNSYQVTAKLVDGDKFQAGCKFRLEVTSDPTTDGDAVIPANGFVIFARGNSTTGCNTGASDFVSALKPGDIVEFNSVILTPEGESIQPRTIVSGNPKNVGGGLTLDTESERADASARHPRTSIGFSEDNSKIIMMVIDGRVSYSVGVTTSMLADVMRFAGAYEAVNLDGGGSSTLYTRALGVRNHCSDGNERAVGNAVFAVLEAPEDNTVAEIQFADWAKTVPQQGQYTPTIYAYNQYGKLIDTNYTSFTLKCDEDLGAISESGTTLLANGSGTHRLTATTPDGIEAHIAVTVVGDAEITPVLTDVLLNSKLAWQVELQSMVDGEPMPVSAEVFDWSTDDADVATVSADGTVQGVADGKCVITGVLGSSTIKVNVTIETPKDVYHHIDPQPVTENWTVKASSAKTTSFTANSDYSFTLGYKLSSVRGPYIKMTRNIAIWSLPEAISVSLDPTNAKLKSMTMSLKANNSTRNASADITTLEAGPAEYEFAIKDFVDDSDKANLNPNNVAIYPLEFTSLLFYLNGTTSEEYTLTVNSIRAKYDESTEGVIDLTADTPEGLPFAIVGDGLTISFAATAKTATVTDLSGRTVAAVRNADSVELTQHGVYVITATIGDTTHTAKIAL